MRKILVLLLIVLRTLCSFANDKDAQIAFGIASKYLHKMPAQVELRQSYFQQTTLSKHYTYQLYYRGLPVFMSQVKVNLTKELNVLSVSNDLCLASALENNVEAIPTLTITNEYNYLCWYVQDNKAVLALYQRTAKIGCDFETITKYGTTIVLRHKNMARNLMADTIIKAKVFLPDPLTSASKTYGGTFTDNGDASAPWLDAERIDVDIPATYESASGLFILKNKYAMLVEKASPVVQPVSQTSNVFHFDRSASGFEDCNALFHISRFHKYFDSIGFSTILPMVTEIDAHGNFGDDNSTFYSTGGLPFLDMGEGGVDDAEDADVLIHEFSHGISWSANGGITNTDDRDGLDEGQADYFATSYSKQIDTFGWSRMFSWDGHNEFWDGRSAVTTMSIQTARTLGIYEVGEVWNTCMMKIYDQIGPLLTDKLMLQSLFSWTPNTTAEIAAAYVVQADSLLNGRAHVGIICDAFRSRGIEPAWGCYALSNSDANIQSLTISNTVGFANGTSNISIYGLEDNGKVNIYDASGRLVYKEIVQNGAQLSPQILLTAGIYTMLIADNKGVQQSFKIMRY
jgi:zinc metalloprotease ZmpB